MARPRRDNSDRPTLSRHAIAERAIALADAHGLEAVTIRRLAGELGVTPMALYWHYRNKDELLDGMAAALLEAVDLPVEASAAWQVQLRAALESLLVVLRAHPATAGLLPTRTVASEGSLRATETLLEILRRGGFSPEDATQIARHALNVVAGLVAAPPGFVVGDTTADGEPDRLRARAHLRALPVDRYPRLVEAAEPLSASVPLEVHAAFGLDLLLAGIEAMAERGA